MFTNRGKTKTDEGKGAATSAAQSVTTLRYSLLYIVLSDDLSVLFLKLIPMIMQMQCHGISDPVLG